MLERKKLLFLRQVKIHLLLYSFTLLFTLPITSLAQQLKSFRGNMTLNSGISGLANYSYFTIDEDSIQRHGRFSFISDVLELESGNDIRQLNINGNYQRGLKNGRWVYDQNDFKVSIKKLTGFKVDAVLDGYMNNMLASYQNGKAQGKWDFSVHEVTESAKKGRSTLAEANFNQGIASGKFTYQDEGRSNPIRIEGQFDENGNFDGEWKISFRQDNIDFREEREYENGFLIYLKLIDANTDELYFEETFNSIREKLKNIKEEGEKLNYKKGDEAFEILFDDGYRRDDAKIRAQERGNKALEYAFAYFSSPESVIAKFDGADLPIMGLTRRFQYVYPEEEKEILDKLKPKLKRMYAGYESIFNNSSFKVNAQRNDSLAFFYEFLSLAMEKTKVIETEVEKILSGRFDYQYRDNYYREGIPALSGHDTIKYEFAGGKKYKVIHLEPEIKGPENLINNLYGYADSLNTEINTYLKYVSEALSIFQQEDQIKELDEKIAQKIDEVQLLYTGDIKQGGSFTMEELEGNSKMNSYQRTIFFNLGYARKNTLIQQYSNAKKFEEKVEKGEQITELMSSLIEIHDKLKELGGMKAELEKAFTRFRPNPYFDRDVETRIKIHIYNRGTDVLLPYLIDNLLSSNNKKEAVERLELIFIFKEKMLELAASEDDDVNRLNSRMRRENQPERIRRLLGI